MVGLHDIEQIAERLAEAAHAERVILFGSHARDDADEESDVDLLIVAPSDQPRWRRTVPLYGLLAGLGIAKDIVWWTQEEIDEWRGVRAHFINTVLREGRVLYERPA